MAPELLMAPDDELQADDPYEIGERRAALARLRRFGGERLMREMSAIFIAALTERVDAARHAVVADDARALALAAHSLKSSCGQFGANSAARVCGEVEAAALGGATAASLAADVERLARECEGCRAWLERELATADPGEAGR